jgi:hypothetical protein
MKKSKSFLEKEFYKKIKLLLEKDKLNNSFLTYHNFRNVNNGYYISSYDVKIIRKLFIPFSIGILIDYVNVINQYIVIYYKSRKYRIYLKSKRIISNETYRTFFN